MIAQAQYLRRGTSKPADAGGSKLAIPDETSPLTATAVRIEPLLLNPGVWFELEVFVDHLHECGAVHLLGNVMNVREIERETQPTTARDTSPVGRVLRGAAETTALATVLAGLTTVAVGASVAELFGAGSKDNTIIAAQGRPNICASEYRLTDQRLVAVERGTGRVLNLPTSDVRATRRRSC